MVSRMDRRTFVEADGQVSWRLAPFEDMASLVDAPGRFLLMSGCACHDNVPNASLHFNLYVRAKVITPNGVAWTQPHCL